MIKPGPVKPEELMFGDIIQFTAQGFVNEKIEDATFTAMFYNARQDDYEDPKGIEVFLIAKPGSFTGQFSREHLDINDPAQLQSMGLNDRSRLYYKSIFIPRELFRYVFEAEHDGVFKPEVYDDLKHEAHRIGMISGTTRRMIGPQCGKIEASKSMEHIGIVHFRSHPLTQMFLSDMSPHALKTTTEKFQASVHDISITDAIKINFLPDFFEVFARQGSPATTLRSLDNILKNAPETLTKLDDVSSIILPGFRAPLDEAIQKLDKAALTGAINEPPLSKHVSVIHPDAGMP